MNNNHFEILRPGINSTFQDSGRNNFYHIGIPFSGAMDNRNYLLSNALVGNNYELPVLEFAYQGPLLRYSGKKMNIAITGDVNFTIKRNSNFINGICYETFTIEDAECTINIPPVVSTVVGVGGLFPGPVSGTATSPPIIANAVIKSAALGTPSNASPLAAVKSQQSKVQLLEQNAVDG